MKKLLTLLVAVTLLSSCDKIVDPLKPEIFECGDCTAADADPFVTNQNVVIEEFTGITCNNCPNAATEVKNLIAKYPGRVFTTGIHASNFATPDPPDYPSDFRTDEGTDIYNFATPIGVPSGLVNRGDYGGSDFAKLYFGWEATVDAYINQGQAAMGLYMEANVDSTTRELCLQVKFKALEDLSGKTLKWCAFLTEGKIIAPQKMPDNSKNPTYEHNHVLRAAINGTFGTPINDEYTGAIGELACETRSYIISQDWKISNCEVVVYVYEDEANSKEVLQALAVHL